MQYSILINNILGRERKITSEPIKVEVVGKPQVLPFKANFKQDFPLHSDAVIKASFCSDPKPRNLKWQWGSLLLTEGKLQKRGSFEFLRFYDKMFFGEISFRLPLFSFSY